MEVWEPFDTDTDHMEEVWYPDIWGAYHIIRMQILHQYYQRFAKKHGLETRLSTKFQYIFDNSLFYSDVDYLAGTIMFLALQNTGWDIEFFRMDGEYESEDNFFKSVKEKNKVLYELLPAIREQLLETTYDTGNNTFYCISNPNIGRYLRENKGKDRDPEMMDIIKNLHPLFFQNSYFAEEINGTYYIAFTLGLIWDWPITFAQIHPNFYAMSYELDQRLRDIYKEEINEK